MTIYNCKVCKLPLRYLAERLLRCDNCSRYYPVSKDGRIWSLSKIYAEIKSKQFPRREHFVEENGQVLIKK